MRTFSLRMLSWMIAPSFDLILCNIPVVKNCLSWLLTLTSLKETTTTAASPVCIWWSSWCDLDPQGCAEKKSKWLPGFFIVRKQNTHNIWHWHIRMQIFSTPSDERSRPHQRYGANPNLASGRGALYILVVSATKNHGNQKHGSKPTKDFRRLQNYRFLVAKLFALGSS